MKGKHLLSMSDLSREDVESLIASAVRLKSGGELSILKGKTLALLFEKPSLRTRVSFEMAMWQLGGRAIYLSPAEVGLGKRESVPDVARVLGRLVDAITARTTHANLKLLAGYSGIPVINALSEVEHPCQALGDLLTIYEKKGRFSGLTLAYVGDGNNVAHSLMLGVCLLGVNFRIASPDGYGVNSGILEQARECAGRSGAEIVSTGKPQVAVRGADVVYTDVWVSMGEEAEADKRRRAFSPYQVNAGLLSLAAKDAILMHPLPAHRGEEVTDEALDSAHSVVFDQAENRLHIQKALLARMLGGK